MGVKKGAEQVASVLDEVTCLLQCWCQTQFCFALFVGIFVCLFWVRVFACVCVWFSSVSNCLDIDCCYELKSEFVCTVDKDLQCSHLFPLSFLSLFFETSQFSFQSFIPKGRRCMDSSDEKWKELVKGNLIHASCIPFYYEIFTLEFICSIFCDSYRSGK